MTMTFVQIERLDYTKPPPNNEPNSERALNSMSRAEFAAMLAEDWQRHKSEHGPPGMDVVEADVDNTDGWFNIGDETYCDEAGARAAAWDWYDRRHKMSVKLEQEKLYIWPDCLMFSNEQIADLEHRLRGLDRAKERLAGVERRSRRMVHFREDERQNGLALCFTVAVTFGLAMPFGMLVSLAAWQQPVGLAEPSVIASVLVAAGLFSFVMSVWLGREMQEKRA